LNNTRRISGFTLVELVVVITIISIMLFFTIPMFNGAGILKDTNKEIGKFIQLIQSLKSESIEEKQDFFLHISMDPHAVWITDSAMDEEALEKARDNCLFDTLEITHIELPGKVSPSPQGIRFSKKGYSDRVIIQLNHGDEAVSLKIEPFLQEVDLIKGHISFDDCI